MGAAKRYASNAERQRAYRERKRNGGGVTELQQWRRSFRSDIYDRLVQIVEHGGIEAGRVAGAAIELSLAEERAWAAVSFLECTDRTVEGYNLQQLVKRKDPRVVQFLEDCRYLR